MRPPAHHSRLGTVTVGVIAVVLAIVTVVYTLLPVIPAPVYPVVFTAVVAVLVVAGVRARRRGAAAAARATAAWAGGVCVLLVLAWSNLLGWGGALVTTLLVALAANALLAMLFRSGIHLAAVQVGALVWAAIAHVYAVPVVPLLLFAGLGMWWLRSVERSRAVVVATAITLPVSLALLVHPLTHDAVRIDGGDVATLAGCLALASLTGALVTRRPLDERLWRVQRTTIVAAAVAQAVLGSIPAVAAFFAPADPWSGLAVGLAGLLLTAAVLVVRPSRRGAIAPLGYAALLWATTASAALLPDPVPAVLAPAVLLVILVRRLSRTNPRSRRGVAIAVGIAASGVALGLLVDAGPFGFATAVATTGLLIVTVAMRVHPVPPRGRTDTLEGLR